MLDPPHITLIDSVNFFMWIDILEIYLSEICHNNSGDNLETIREHWSRLNKIDLFNKIYKLFII